MKLVVVVLVSLTAFGMVGMLGGAALALNRPGIIRITATITKTTGPIPPYIGSTTIEIANLYNRPKYQGRIGTEIMACTYSGDSQKRFLCRGSFSLARGKIQVAGTRRGRSYYVLAVTGGTGFYAGVTGQLVGAKIGPKIDSLAFGLKP